MSNYSVTATIRVVDHDVAEPARPDDLARIPAPLTGLLTEELDEAARHLAIPADEILLGALGRTIARTLGAGDLQVDVSVKGADSTVTLACTTVRQASATEALLAVGQAIAGGDRLARDLADVHFAYTGSVPEPAYIQALPTGAHALEIRVYRAARRVQMDWWYDTRRLDRYTVEEMTEQFPLALIDLTSEASPLAEDSAEIGDTHQQVMAGSL
jgi:hypothetical protein